MNTYDVLVNASRWQPLVLQPANSPNALGAPYIQVHITPQARPGFQALCRRACAELKPVPVKQGARNAAADRARQALGDPGRAAATAAARSQPRPRLRSIQGAGGTDNCRAGQPDGRAEDTGAPCVCTQRARHAGWPAGLHPHARAAGPQAEFFDVKTLSLGVALFQNKAVLANYRPLKLVDLIRLGLVNGLAIYDANIEGWKAKVRLPSLSGFWHSLLFPSMCSCGRSSACTFTAQVHFDAIRPISAIRYTYGDSPITAWLGPGKGTGATTGNGYRSYLRTMQHSDYPSGSGCAFP